MKAFFSKIWSWATSTASKAWKWSVAHKAIAITTASVVFAGATCAIVLPIVLRHEHEFGTELQKNDTHHYYACECGEKKDETVHSYIIMLANSETLKAESTASTKAQYYKTCVCGKISTTDYFETDKNATTLSVTMSGKTYDGGAVANPTYDKGTADGAVTIEWYQGETKLNEVPVNAGNYKVKVIVAETANYVGVSQTKDFTIEKATPNLNGVTMNLAEIQYGNNYDVNYTKSGDGAVTKEYKVRGADDSTYSTTVPTNAGNYTARVTVAEASNYLSASSTVDFVICPITLTGLEEDFEYNGESVHEVDFSSSYSGVKISVTFENAIVGAQISSYSVFENDAPTSNYVVDVNTFNASIVKKELGVQWTAPANLYFDETEKVPTATLTGVVQGDACVVEIELFGNNIWFGETFSYRAISLVGEDATNYKLPDYVDSTPYTITIDEAQVGTEQYVYAQEKIATYFKVSLLELQHYYLTFEEENQGEKFTFEIYKKGENTPVAVREARWADAVTLVMDELPFYVSEGEGGDYLVKCIRSEVAGWDGGNVTINLDEHTNIDDYGFCNKGCDTYQGNTIESGEEVTLSLNNGEKAYYRLPCIRTDHVYSRKFVAPLQSGDFAFYYNDGTEWQEIELTANPQNDFGSDTPDYIYVVITAGSDFEDSKFTMFEDHDVSVCGNYECGDKNGEYIGEDFGVNTNDSVTISRGEKKYYRFEADEGKLYAILCVDKQPSVSVVCYRIENGNTVVQQLTKDKAELGDTDDGYYYIVFENESVVSQTFTFQIEKADF